MFQPCWLFFDWADLRSDGVSIALNAIYAKTLDEAARLERWPATLPTPKPSPRTPERVRDGVNRYCPGRHYYPDVLFRNEKKQLVALARGVGDHAIPCHVGRHSGAAANAANVAGPAR